MYPTPEEKRIFKEIIKLALDKKYEEAEKVAKTFPFVRDFELENVDGREVQ